MERVLELADICGYLPYGLNVQINPKFKQSGSFEIKTAHFGTQKVIIGVPKYGNESHEVADCIPILRPMSNITKLMNHPDINDGKMFKPINQLFIQTPHLRPDTYYAEREFEINRITKRFIEAYFFDGIDYQEVYIPIDVSTIPLLSKLHFDYQGLIGEGLAVELKE